MPCAMILLSVQLDMNSLNGYFRSSGAIFDNSQLFQKLIISNRNKNVFIVIIVSLHLYDIVINYLFAHGQRLVEQGRAHRGHPQTAHYK